MVAHLSACSILIPSRRQVAGSAAAGCPAATKTNALMPLREALRNAASALKEHGPRFALAGSYALWAYGAPEPSHDADVVVTESDAAAAAATLRDAGFSVEHPPKTGCSRPAPVKRW